MALDLRPERYGSKPLARGAELTGEEILSRIDPVTTVAPTMQTSGVKPGGRVAVNDWMNRYNRIINGVSKHEDMRNGGFTRDASGGYMGNINSLIADYENIRDIADQYGFEDSEKYFNQLKQLQNSIGEMNDIFAQFDDEEEYSRYVEYLNDREEKRKVDLKAYGQEIARLEQALEDYDPDIDWTNPTDRKKFDAEIEAMQAEIDKRKRYYTQAKRIQDEDASAEKYGKVSKSADFASKSGYDPSNQEIGYQYVNADASGRMDLEQKYGKYATQFADMGIDSMNDEERAVYNYYMNSGERKEAAAYLRWLEETLQIRKGEETDAALDKIAEDSPGGAKALRYAFMANLGYDQHLSGMEGMGNMIAGKDNYVPATATQVAGERVREDLGQYGRQLPEWMGGGSTGQMVGDVISTTANMAPSILASTMVGLLNPSAGATVGRAMMSGSAAGSGYQEMINEGYSKEQARLYGLGVGAAEYFMESALSGISKLGGVPTKALTKWAENVDDALFNFALRVGGSGFSEGLEEGLTDVVTGWLKSKITQEDFYAEPADALYSSLLGFITGILFEGPSVASDIGQQSRQGKAFKDAKGVDALKEMGAVSTDSTTRSLADRIGSDSGNFAVGKLARKVESEITGQNSADLAQSLTQKGMPENTAKQYGEMLSYMLEAGSDTEIQRMVMESDPVIGQVLREAQMPGSKVQQRLQDLSAASGKTRSIERVASLYGKQAEAVKQIYNQGQKADGTKQDVETFAYGFQRAFTVGRENGKVSAVTEEIAPGLTPSQRELAYNLGRDAVAAEKAEAAKRTTGEESSVHILNEDGSLGDAVRIAEISSNDRDNVTYVLEDGRTVSEDQLSFSGDNAVLDTVKELGLDVQTANIVIRGNKTITKADTLVAHGIDDAFRYGSHGYSLERLAKDSPFAALLTEEMRTAVYNAGKNAPAAAVEKPPAVKVKTRGKNAGIYYDAGGGNVTAYRPKQFGKLEHKRESGVYAAQVLQKLGIGVDFYFFRSYVNSKGERVYLDAEGMEQKAPNGWYDKSDGSIHIDLNAGNDGQGLTLFTMAHELTHFIEQWSPEKYKVLADFLIQNYEKGRSMDELVLIKQQALSAGRTKPVSYEEAYSEVIADSMEAMLADGNVMDKLRELKAQDSDLVARMKEFFDRMVKRITKYYQGLQPESEEGKLVLEMKDQFEQIQQLFAEALVEASENLQAASDNDPAVAGQDMSNEEAFLDSETAVHYQIRPPYADGSKAFNAFVEDLNPEARKTFDLFYGFYQRSRITNTVSVSGKKVKAVNISSLYLLAQDWNDMIAKEPKWAAAAMELADFLPADVRKRMNMNEDGTLIPTTMEKEFKMPSSMAQRLVDALPYESIDARYTMGDKTVTLPEGKARQSVGGEAYRRAIIAETRKLFAEGKLKPVSIGTMSKDRWGSLGFLAANGKTGASGDFTTVCPQMMFNRGCWYCYRRAAMEKGVNNKLVANNVWYTGEILRIKDSDIDALNRNGGLRIQSFGDWMPHFSAMLADVLYDAEQRGLQVKIITKEPSMINYIAALRDQNVGKNLYFNLSADYTIEKGPAKQAQGGDSLDAVNPERPYMRDRNNNFWWKRAMTVEEAAKYREKYPWVNTRIVATDIAEFIRGLKDNRVDVVTGYHGNIRGIERIDSATGAEKVEVEALGDAGMPRFAFNPSTGTWFTEYEGKTATHKRLAQAIADNGLQWEYYIKTCCITGRCATCEGKCGALARDFNVKNATNRDDQSVAYWQKQMEYAVEPEFGDLTDTDDGRQYQIRQIGNTGKFYVQADRQVLSGTDPDAWGKQIENYINEEIRKNQDVAFPTQDGHLLLLTGRSAYKLKDRHVAAIRKKAEAFLADAGYQLKGHAATHIDELIQVARFKKYEADRDRKHENDIGEDGFNYFAANFRDFDGKYYIIHFSAGVNAQEETVYSIGNIRQRSFPADKGSSSGKEALKDGRKASGDIIYSSSDESQQEKSAFALAYEAASRGKQNQDRSTGTSNRALLAGAFDQLAQKPDEREFLQKYRDNIAELDKQEAKLQELRRQIREISFGKGPRDMQKLKELQEEATKTANRINTYDKILLNLEATVPLKRVLEREKSKAYNRAQKHAKQVMENYRERRERTVMRHKVERVVNELNNLLTKPTKTRHVLPGLQKPVAEMLEALNMGSDEKQEQIYQQISRYQDLLATEKAKPEPQMEVIEAYKAKIEKLQNRGEKLSDNIARLKNAYAEIKKSTDPEVAGAYMPEIEEQLEILREEVGDTPLQDMSLQQMDIVYNAYKMVLHNVTHANRLFGKLQKITAAEMTQEAAAQIRSNGIDTKDPPKGLKKVSDKVNEMSWQNLRPVDAFRRLGSEKMMDLFWGLVDGMNERGKMAREIRDYLVKARKDSSYSKFDLKKADTYTTVDGKKMRLTLGEKMSIYAYSKREAAFDHMTKGGFTYAEAQAYKDEKGVTRYHNNAGGTWRLSLEDLENICNSLTAEQKRYADTMQKFLTEFGQRGNKVSRALFGIDLFKEQNYFPLMSNHDYLNSVQTDLGATQTAASLKNSGFTKSTTPGANNPIVLKNFDDVCLEHLDKMMNYIALTLPLENLRKVYDNVSSASENTEPQSTKALIGAVYGKGAQKYFDQFLKDANGTRAMTGARNPLASLFSKSKAAAVSANVSVMIQQISAVVRASAEISPAHLVAARGYGEGTTRGKKSYEEMMTYSGIANIKDMGGYDVGSSTGLKDYLGMEEAPKSREKFWDIAQDAFGFGAEFMDKVGWTMIWNAVKREVASRKQYTVNSAEFFQACADRFEEVVVKTQVFDSVLSRSGYMRSDNDSVKYLTSFMGEPTVTAGMVFNSHLEVFRAVKNRKSVGYHVGKLVRTDAALIVTLVINGMLKALPYAARDDDEDESYWERWARHFGDSLRGDMNPLNLLPVARDISSIWGGRTIDRPDLALLSDLVTIGQKAIEILMDEDAREELEAKDYWQLAEDVLGAVGNLAGVPVQNIWRDIESYIRVAKDIQDDIKTVELRESLERGLRGEKKTKLEGIYDAMVSGDTARLEALKATYKTEGSFESAVRKALRKHDPRIQEMGNARYEDDYERLEKLSYEIEDEGIFDMATIKAAYEAERKAQGKERGILLEEDSEEEKKAETTVFSMEAYYSAIRSGGSKESIDIAYDALLDEKLKEYYLEREAKDSIESSVISKAKGEYLDEDITKAEAVSVMTKYGGKTKDEAETEIKKWNFQKKYNYAWGSRDRCYRSKTISRAELERAVMDIEGATAQEAREYVDFLDLEMRHQDVDITSVEASGYFKHAKPSGISVEVYLDYKSRTKGIENDKDANGKAVAYSAVRKIMNEIGRLPLTDAQKHALAKSNGWADSTIQKYKTW